MTTMTRRAGVQKRHRRVRKNVVGSAERPRLAVFRSSRHIYVQLIDDHTGSTLAAASTLAEGKGDPKARAKSVGAEIASKAKAAGIERAVFDRGGFRYHGRVQAVAEGAREGGLQF